MAELPYDQETAKSDFFDTTNFRNCIHASNIAVWNHFSSLIFKGELDRLVYASSEFAFRARSRALKGSDNLDLPFMNFRIDPGGLENGVDRSWWNHIGNIRGVWIPELSRNLKFSPITLNYDSTLFVHKDVDAMFAISELFWDDSNETQLRPKVVIDGEEIEIPGDLGYSLNPYSRYNESEWLRENKMIAIQVNMSLGTFIIKDNSNISIPQEVVLNFSHGLGLSDPSADDYEPDVVYTGTIDHLNETVDWSF